MSYSTITQIKKKITSFETACKVLQTNPSQLPDVSLLSQEDQKAILSHFKLIKIAEALNEGWKPNWSDYNEYKYYPWFYMPGAVVGSGAGFSYGGYSCDGSDAAVGSRLCFRTRELAEYAGKQFEDLYKEYMVFSQ